MPTSFQMNSYKGVSTALVTPFLENGDIDYDSFDRTLDFQIKSGIHGLVPCGTTGEGPTLSESEKEKIVSLCVKKAQSRIPVIVGTGSNDTKKTIEASKKAQDLGANACLVVAPYYNKPTQDGLLAHFSKVAESISIPMIIYNIPGRSIVSVAPETLGKLSQHSNIIGLKDSSADMNYLTKVRREIKKDFVYLCGEDPTYWPFLANGGNGTISVISNAIPRAVISILNSLKNSDMKTGLGLHEALSPISNGIFIETSPAPIKQVLEWMGLCKRYVRLPLVELRRENLEKLKAIWNQLSVEIKA
ncbi:MAG: 4-hydroxy-tetrahydrodipicolinate synthase [Bacteriovoracia bacterium]